MTRGSRLLTALVLVVVVAMLGSGPLAHADDSDAGTSPTRLQAPPVAPRAPQAPALPGQDHPDFIDVPARCRDPKGFPAPGACWVTARPGRAPIVFLWGDSHAWMMTPALRAAVRGTGVSLVLWFAGGCPPGLSLAQPGRASGCDRSGQEAVRWVAQKVAAGRAVRVVLGTSWELYRDAITPRDDVDRRFPGFTNDSIRANATSARRDQPRALRALNRLGVAVDLIGQMPMLWLFPPTCARGLYQCDLPRWGVLKDARANNARIDQLRRIVERGRVIRPARRLCSKTLCRGRLDGHPVYLDPLHLGQRTTATLGPFFATTVAGLRRDARRR